MKNHDTTLLKIYALGYVEAWLEAYARSHSIPSHEFTGNVSALLYSQTSGQVLGTDERMSGVRRTTKSRHKTLAPMAVAERAHRNAPESADTYQKVIRKEPTDVLCNLCGRHFPSRSAQMKHRVRKHGYKVSNKQAKA